MSNAEKLDRLLELSAEAAAFGLLSAESEEYSRLKDDLLAVLPEATERSAPYSPAQVDLSKSTLVLAA